MRELFCVGVTETTPPTQSRRVTTTIAAALVLVAGFSIAGLVFFTGLERGIVGAYYFALHMLRGL